MLILKDYHKNEMSERKKKIVIFLNAFWNNGRGMSGGDQMLVQIFKRIRNSFGEMDCYTNFDGQQIIAKETMDMRFHISPRFFDRLPLFLGYILRTIYAFGIIFHKKVDIIYGGSDFPPDVIPSFLYKIFYPKTKWFQCVFHIYPDWKKRPGNKIRNMVAQYLQRISFLFIKKADIIININHQVEEELVKVGFDKEKIFVNTPGIDVEYFRNLKMSDNVPQYDGTFLARLNPSKGIFDLVKIWKRVVEKKPESKLAIIGGGSEEIKNKLKNEIKKNNLEKNVEVLGFLENDESFSIIKNSKVFIFPSHEEGFGIAIVEAMACGAPVISWDLRIYEEIFENFSIQVKENDIDHFAREVNSFLQDQNRRSKYGINAKHFVKKYSWDAIAKRHQRMLGTA